MLIHLSQLSCQSVQAQAVSQEYYQSLVAVKLQTNTQTGSICSELLPLCGRSCNRHLSQTTQTPN